MRSAVRVLRRAPARPPAVVREPIVLSDAAPADAGVIHSLIVEHLAEGHLLPRERHEVAAHAARFVVAARGGVVVACAELAPLSPTVAEVRSFVVSRHVRRLGVGRRLIDALAARARRAGFRKLSAFTHSPGYFVHLGFSIVPHTWVPEKIAANCAGCRHFRICGQYAVMRILHHG